MSKSHPATANKFQPPVCSLGLRIVEPVIVDGKDAIKCLLHQYHFKSAVDVAVKPPLKSGVVKQKSLRGTSVGGVKAKRICDTYHRRLMGKLRKEIRKALPGWTFSHTSNGISEIIKFTGPEETLEVHLRPAPRFAKTVDA